MLKTFLTDYFETNLERCEEYFADPKTIKSLKRNGIEVRDGNTDRLASLLLEEFVLGLESFLKGYEIKKIELFGWKDSNPVDATFEIDLENGKSFHLNSRAKAISGSFNQSFELDCNIRGAGPLPLGTCPIRFLEGKE